MSASKKRASGEPASHRADCNPGFVAGGEPLDREACTGVCERLGDCETEQSQL